MLLVDTGVCGIAWFAGVEYLPDIQVFFEDFDESLIEISNCLRGEVDCGIGSLGIVDVEGINHLSCALSCVDHHFGQYFWDVVLREGSETVSIVEDAIQLRILVDIGLYLGVNRGGSTCLTQSSRSILVVRALLREKYHLVSHELVSLINCSHPVVAGTVSNHEEIVTEVKRISYYGAECLVCVGGIVEEHVDDLTASVVDGFGEGLKSGRCACRNIGVSHFSELRGCENGNVKLRVRWTIESDDLDLLHTSVFVVENIYLLDEGIESIGIGGSICTSDDHSALELLHRVCRKSIKGVDGVVLGSSIIQLVKLTVGDALPEKLSICWDCPSRWQDDGIYARLADELVHWTEKQPRVAILARTETCREGLVTQSIVRRWKQCLKTGQRYLSQYFEYIVLAVEEEESEGGGGCFIYQITWESLCSSFDICPSSCLADGVLGHVIVLGTVEVAKLESGPSCCLGNFQTLESFWADELLGWLVELEKEGA